ncbi:MAG TPA: penicillin-binding transpeptidase domain-containing protein [Candidatus Paceibacterota bacterium]|nr:penicillin-binding transpeptidase domain-containing protein [Candidatus Paceibacterota bacterium]
MIRWRKSRKQRGFELNPDEILLDAHNLPAFNTQQFEGRVERPIRKQSLRLLFLITLAFSLIFVGKLVQIQLVRGAYFAEKSDQNSLEHTLIFAGRGIIYDRSGVELAWNDTTDPERGPRRSYISQGGFASLLGYVSYPTKDSAGKFWQEYIAGKDGLEKEYNELLSGKNGVKLVETNVKGELLAENVIEAPLEGKNLTLALDAGVQEELYRGITALAAQSGYRGGAGAIMDIHTGELLALTSFPQYDQAILSDGTNKTAIASYLKSSEKPFLNRTLNGLYTPGSIVKPFLALGALQEGTITPEKIIVSTGKLVIPNPYNLGLESVFKDNKAHGPVDMRRALAVSSNVYFYQLGGGFGSQQGLGIANIEKYATLFGIGKKTGIDISGEKEGNIPSIAWKEKRFPGDPWRIGDTYNTSIGQYGFQVTPLQMLRAVAGVASRGTLVTPRTVLLSASENSEKKPETVSLPIKDEVFTVVQEGMRLCVTEGTCTALQMSEMAIAAKTGTAQIKQNTRVNSWVIGFFPYEAPQYAFVVLMEDGPLISSGAAHAIKPVFSWMRANRPELLTLPQ